MNGGRETSRTDRTLTAVAGVLGLTSVVSLLAWVFGLGSFARWFRAVSLPGMVGLVALGLVSIRRRDLVNLRETLMLGIVAGIIGTLGYDLFRVPFVLFGGLRLLSPIESYGVLALDATASSGWTDLVGWSYHVANGIGFAIAYMAVARRRHWAFGLAWALALETATVITPFASAYALTGKWGIIALAYGAHVPYGLALGIIGQRADRWLGHLREVGRYAVPGLLAATGVVLVAWLAPGLRGEAPSPDAADGVVVVDDGRFEPQWFRIPVGGCLRLHNTDPVAYQIDAADGAPEIAATSTGSVCFSEEGVTRVHTAGAAYDGGFVIVDAAA